MLDIDVNAAEEGERVRRCVCVVLFYRAGRECCPMLRVVGSRCHVDVRRRLCAWCMHGRLGLILLRGPC